MGIKTMPIKVIAMVMMCLTQMLCAGAAIASQITVAHIELRATVAGMKATGGYAHITNDSTQDVRLVAVEAGFAAKAEIHTMIAVDGVMKMRQLKNGLVIPAGGHARLEPGGNHLMFMGLSAPLLAGIQHAITLHFDNGVAITEMAHVKRPADIGKHTGDHAHDASHAKHSQNM